MIGRSEALAAFEARRDAPTAPTHRDAAQLVDRSGDPDAIGAMYDRFVDLLQQRPNARHVPVTRGDVTTTVALVEAQIR